jgi:hypothetical protein
MKKQDQKSRHKEHLAHFNIAGFTYYDGPEAFGSLRMGEKLSLSLDPDNRYDERAVRIDYKDWKLGYVPRGENRILYKLLRTGTTNIELRVQRLDATEHPEAQVQVVAHLVSSVDPS